MSPFALLWFAVLPVMHPSSSASINGSGQSQEYTPSATATNAYIREYLGRLDRLSLKQTGPDRASIIMHMRRFYAALGNRPAWTNRQAVARLIEVIEDSANDGLVVSDYHLDEIRNYYTNPPASPDLMARADILMTDAVFTLMSHMRSGKVYARSIESDWNIAPPLPGQDYDRTLMSAVMGSKFPEIIQSLRPASSEYSQLRKGLIRMREIAAAGGWESVPSGPAIDKVGVADQRIPAIRRRLEVTGDVARLPVVQEAAAQKEEEKEHKEPSKRRTGKKDDTSSGADSLAIADTLRSIPVNPDELYTAELFEAVVAFQKRHGLNPDGVIGNETIKAMNVPVGQRIDQIRINLERYRWFLNSRGANYVMVNIPGFSVELVQNGLRRWNSRVIVGTPDNKTPVFRAEMQYIIVNPQWVIPPGILTKEAIPAIIRDRSYLQRKRLAVVDENGQRLSPASVDWSSYSGGSFPYRLVQASGDDGSLGRIKFMLPNKFMVYMHDTPSKDLFGRSRRAFSHGCVRVENPIDLAEVVLQDSVKWNRKKIQAAIDARKTRSIDLPRNFPVYIMYQTAFSEGDQLQLRPDVYDRDSRLLKVLDSQASSRFVDSATR
ncbi:MAG: L,D-transpeptidase family protein [Chlorobiaceae bacterium]|nr:L,D-transpeptidase family protein [Chlorobiaceae bacterium]NTW74362.1 L,D-transpeptidase family protein [Chlorobiaceae bacterium]